ncbi:MAG: glutathione binding-like protein [Burkholderiaceae bacterium]
MYDVYFWTTPNGYKPLLMLEEIGAQYQLKSINIGKDEQFAPAFLAVSPNNKIPAIVDHAPADGGEPISVFESGAILLYLAEKSGRFLPRDVRGRTQAYEWLMWQMGGLGPMAGQAHHFLGAKEQVPYGIERYTRECQRLYGVLNARLDGRPFVAGDEYSVADMAIYPWVWRHERHRVSLDDFPNVREWYARIGAREATARASARGAELNPGAQALLG